MRRSTDQVRAGRHRNVDFTAKYPVTTVSPPGACGRWHSGGLVPPPCNTREAGGATWPDRQPLARRAPDLAGDTDPFTAFVLLALTIAANVSMLLAHGLSGVDHAAPAPVHSVENMMATWSRDSVRDTLQQNAFEIVSEERLGSDLGWGIRCSGGEIINVFDSGSLSI